MAQSDWTALSDNLSSGNVKTVASGAFTPPPDAGDAFMWAWKSQNVTAGNVCYFYNGAGFAPCPKGGLISAALKRGKSAGPAGFAVYLFACLQGTQNTFSAYQLGLADADPAHLVLRKGQLVGGLPDVAPVPVGGGGGQGVLWRSSDVWSIDTWVHVMLMVATNPNGDAVITVWQNDLTVPIPSVNLPNWVQVPGVNMLGQSGSGIIDDAAGINTGSPSLTSGRMGFGFTTSDVGRVAMVDFIQGTAQT